MFEFTLSFSKFDYSTLLSQVYLIRVALLHFLANSKAHERKREDGGGGQQWCEHP